MLDKGGAQRSHPCWPAARRARTDRTSTPDQDHTADAARFGQCGRMVPRLPGERISSISSQPSPQNAVDGRSEENCCRNIAPMPEARTVVEIVTKLFRADAP